MEAESCNLPVSATPAHHNDVQTTTYFWMLLIVLSELESAFLLVDYPQMPPINDDSTPFGLLNSLVPLPLFVSHSLSITHFLWLPFAHCSKSPLRENKWGRRSILSFISIQYLVNGKKMRGGNSIDDWGDVVTPDFLFISCSPGALW